MPKPFRSSAVSSSLGADSLPSKTVEHLFWSIIEDLDVDSKTLVDNIIKDGKLPTDLSVENKQVVAELRIKFANLF